MISGVLIPVTLKAGTFGVGPFLRRKEIFSSIKSSLFVLWESNLQLKNSYRIQGN